MAENDRLISLDVFRGLTIAGMVLVNNPGGSPVYWPLEHAAWHGLTPTDWIFPFFLFIVGVSISIALGKRAEAKPDRQTYTKIVIRSASIYLLGAAISVVPFFQFQATDAPDPLKMLIWLTFCASLLFLLLRNYKIAAVLFFAALLGIAGMNLAGYNVVPYNYGTLRIFGVLQRIAVCYLITSIIFLHTNWKQQVGIGVALLLGYWIVTTVIPVPGCELTTINDKACNLAAYIDRLILTENHIWRGGKVYDPEGILSTIPAIVTTISGVLTGTWLLSSDKGRVTSDERSDLSLITHHSSLNKVSGLFFFGITLLALGLIWNSYFQMNKALWTSSYVLATTGLALLVLGFCYWLLDIKGYERWAWPFKVFGANALALFVFTGFFARMISAYRVTGADGQLISVQKVVMQSVFLPIFNPIDASLAFAISFILLWLFLMWLLYRRRIYVKV
ncbi:MAG: heparan-alpha-glucosaminide N-acetyltransferase domain-containing protein [Pyrinomonadaceae bacterium]